MRNFISIIIVLVGFSSCEKKEIPIAPHIPGDEIVTQLNMQSDYRDQIWFRLNDNQVVSQNHKTIWDLSFESSEEGWHILLNSSKLMAASFYEGLDLSDEPNFENANWIWDTHSGALDSTAIGDWKGQEGIYLVDKGYDQVGIHQGYIKLKITSFDNISFTFSYAELNSNSISDISITKNPSKNFTAFSFNEEDHFPEVMPDNDNWDIVFTQYTFIYYDLELWDLEEITPYLVTGVILNRNGVQAKKFSGFTDEDFEDVNLEFASTQFLYENIDEIGHEWKEFDLEIGTYEIFSDQVFIIKDTEGFYYKLRFTDFYGDSGAKGAPKFEFQKL